jgi:hypothetical protein
MSKLKISFVKNTPMKIVLENFYFDYYGKTLKIPRWYAFDWLSIPRPMQWVVDMNQSNNIISWLIHDYLYSKISWVENRRKIDSHFYYNIRYQNPPVKSALVFIGVYYFGGFSFKKDYNYNKYKKEIISVKKDLWI